MALFDGLPVPQMTDPNQRAIQARSVMLQGLASGMALGQRRRFRQDEMKMRQEQMDVMAAAKERQIAKGMTMMDRLSKAEVKGQDAPLKAIEFFQQPENMVFLVDPDTSELAQNVLKTYSAFGKVQAGLDKANTQTAKAKTAANIDKTFWEGVSKVPAMWQSEIIDMGFTDEGRPSANQFKALGVIQERIAAEKAPTVEPQPFSVTTPGGTTEEGVYNPKTGHFKVSNTPPTAEEQVSKKKLTDLTALDTKYADQIAKLQQDYAGKQSGLKSGDEETSDMKELRAKMLTVENQRSGLQGQIKSLQNPESAPTTDSSIVTTKEQFDALESGAVYTGKDGRQYRKP